MTKKILLCLLFVVFIFFTGCTNNIKTDLYEEGQKQIETLEDLLVCVNKKCSGSVVCVSNYKKFPWELSSHGSGFIIKGQVIYQDKTEDDIRKQDCNKEISHYKYQAITNHHVIEDARYIGISIDGKNDLPDKARIVKYDKDKDLALLEFKASIALMPLELEKNVKMGEIVLVIGTPEGKEYFNSLTMGIVSSHKRTINEEGKESSYIQTDVAINHGNSGGPLLNLEGKVIGVVATRLEKDKDEEGHIASMGFAIPASDVIEFIKAENDA